MQVVLITRIEQRRRDDLGRSVHFEISPELDAESLSLLVSCFCRLHLPDGDSLKNNPPGLGAKHG